MKRSVHQAKQLVDALRACEDELYTQITKEVIEKRAEPPSCAISDNETLPTCPICQDDYSQHEVSDRHWVKLGCGHWYCEECLLTHVRVAEAAYNKCPMCRGAIVDNPTVQEVDERADLLAEALDMEMDLLASFTAAYRQQLPLLTSSQQEEERGRVHEVKIMVNTHHLRAAGLLDTDSTDGWLSFSGDVSWDHLWWWRVQWSLRFGTFVSAASGCAKLSSNWGSARAGVIGGPLNLIH